MEEVQIIKASKDKVIRNGAISYEKIRVAPYCRVSTDSDEQKNSYESQKKYYQELILKKPEWELVDIYADEAISGTQVYKRNDFQRMINDAMDGKIDIIKNKINSLRKLESFDREVFECVISKIIIGKVSESEEKYPLHITFVFKTGDEISGYTKSTKKKNVIDKYIENESNGNIRNNECLNIQCDTNEMCPYVEYDAL